MIDEFHRIDQGPSTDVAHIQAELTRSDLPCPTPLAGYAQHIFDLGVRYNVDPAFFVATSYEENWYGTYPTAGAWDCFTHSGTYNWVSIGNAAYGGHAVAGSRWGQYPDIPTGIEAFFKLLTTEYYPRGQRDLHSVWWGLDGVCPCNATCPGGSSSECPGRQVCNPLKGVCSGDHAYGPCWENPCINFYGTVLGIMNRLAASVVPPVCDPPYVYDPISGGCILPEPVGDGVDTGAVGAIAAGLGLLAGAFVLGWRFVR